MSGVTKFSDMTPAETCRKNGWIPGTRLVGDEGYGPTVIEITAIGHYSILAVTISHDGKPGGRHESSWTLAYRDWKVIEGDGISDE